MILKKDVSENISSSKCIMIANNKVYSIKLNVIFVIQIQFARNEHHGKALGLH